MVDETLNIEDMLSFGEISNRLINQSKIIDKFGGMSSLWNIDKFDFDALHKFYEICAFEMVKTINMKPSLFTADSIKSFNRRGDYFSNLHNSVYWLFNKGKIFNLDENLFNLINKTKNKVYYRRMPFISVFLNKEFEVIDGVKVFGVLITEGIEEGDKFIDVLTLGFDYRDKSCFYKYFPIKNSGLVNNPEEDKSFNKSENKKIEKKIATLVCNFLDFLNHPDIKTRIIKWENNEKRISKGKLPIQDKVIIDITGKLYKYIYEDYPLQKEQHNSPSYSFEVRGHYIHFWNKKRWKWIYSLEEDKLKDRGYQIDEKGIISKWILPYIKGEGILKNKQYNLKE